MGLRATMRRGDGRAIAVLFRLVQEPRYRVRVHAERQRLPLPRGRMAPEFWRSSRVTGKR